MEAAGSESNLRRKCDQQIRGCQSSI